MDGILDKAKSVPIWAWVAIAIVVALVLTGVGGSLLSGILGGGSSTGTDAAGNGATTATTQDAATSQSLSDMSYALQQQQEAYTQQIVGGQGALAQAIGTASGQEQSDAAATQGMVTSGFGNQTGLLSGLGSQLSGLQSSQNAGVSGLSNELQALSASQAGGFSSLANQVQGGFSNTAAGQAQGNALIAEMQQAMANFKVPAPVAAAAKSSYSGAPGEQHDTVPAGAVPSFGNQSAQIQKDFTAAYGANAAQAWQQQHNAQVARYGS